MSSKMADDEIAVKMVILTMKNYQSWLSNQKIRCSKLFGKQANVLKTNMRNVSSSPKEGLYAASGNWASAVETDSVEEAEANS